MLEERARGVARDGYIFGDGTNFERPFSGFGKRFAALAAAMPEGEPWTLHDIRRTVATRLHEAGTDALTVEDLLGHLTGVRSGVAGIYNRASTLERQRRSDRGVEHKIGFSGGPDGRRSPRLCRDRISYRECRSTQAESDVKSPLWIISLAKPLGMIDSRSSHSLVWRRQANQANPTRIQRTDANDAKHPPPDRLTLKRCFSTTRDQGRPPSTGDAFHVHRQKSRRSLDAEKSRETRQHGRNPHSDRNSPTASGRERTNDPDQIAGRSFRMISTPGRLLSSPVPASQLPTTLKARSDRIPDQIAKRRVLARMCRREQNPCDPRSGD